MKLQPKMVLPVIAIVSVSFAIYWVGRSDNKTAKNKQRYHWWIDAHLDREMDIAADSARRRRRSLPVLQRRTFDSMTTDAATGLAVITATAADEVIQASPSPTQARAS